MPRKRIVIENKYGLHIRVAAQLVTLAKRFSANITIAKNGQRVDAKSIFQVLELAAEQGASVEIDTVGDDAENALSAVIELLTKRGEV